MKRIVCLRIEAPTAEAAGALQTVAAYCKQFTPRVGIDPDAFPQSVLLDITQVVHLFGGEEALVEQIVAKLHAQGWQFRTSLANTPGAAWALAGYGEKAEEGKKGEGDILPFSPSSFLPFSPSSILPLPLEALRLPEPTIALLHSLGVWRIGQLEALPRRELSSRFGPELLDCLDRLTGRLPEPLPAWEPPPQFAVNWSAEFPAAQREIVAAALEHLVRRLADMLTRAGRGAMRLECLLRCMAGDPLQVVVGLFRPTAWANHLLQLLQVQFDSLQLPGPVESIRLTAASTAPLELRQQEMFCEGRRRAGPHHLSSLIDRLSNRLGHTCVMRVRLIPEAQPELACHYLPLVFSGKGPARFGSAGSPGRAATRESQKIDLTPFFRPLRLLPQPLRLPAGIDGPFSFAGRQEPILRRLGPERIETGWWRGRTVARDYYRIETTTGRCYWVFRRLPDGPWFLHGMFD